MSRRIPKQKENPTIEIKVKLEDIEVKVEEKEKEVFVGNEDSRSNNDDFLPNAQEQLETVPKTQKDYRKNDANGIRSVKTVSFRCLAQMKKKNLYKYWSKMTLGLRSKRYTILLIIMILANENDQLVKKFIRLYKKACGEIIGGQNSDMEINQNETLFKSAKHHLAISILAAEEFIKDRYNIDSGLRHLQNKTQIKYYNKSMKDLNEFQEFIKANKHKNIGEKKKIKA